MQFHHNGFKSGDPTVAEPAPTIEDRSAVDVLIVGSGPAGLTLATQLAAFGDINTRIVEQKPGPLQIGQADGIACRSMEMFEAFGFADKVAKEAYWVNETVFWRPDLVDGGLARAGRIQDVEDDLSEMPHVILSQARIHDFYLELMARSPRRLEPDYGCQLVGLRLAEDPDYRVVATVQRLDSAHDAQVTETIRARYVVGCDGARSAVRNAMGYELDGEAARQLWGVMDVLAVTDFPDIRLKAAIQSVDQGSLLIIPREGGYMVRMYIELDELRGGERAGERGVTPDVLINKAQAILAPYTVDVKEVAWWSAYEIGQRLCPSFDNVDKKQRPQQIPRILIAGDACHTHSPKAGQGMNVAMADAFNLGWKLATVIQGRARPQLLHTYTEERHAKAKELIDFDKIIAELFSAKPDTPAEAQQFQRYFQKQARYTAGVETRYAPSMITLPNTHQQLAAGLVVGMRFHSAPVVRLADAKPLQLGHVLKADGRWRIVVFGPQGDNGQRGGPVDQLCSYLVSNRNSPVRRYTPEGSDIDSVIDVRAVFQADHRDMAVESLPGLLLPRKGTLELIDYQKAFCPNLKDGPDIFDLRTVNRTTGAIVLVRPDQYIAGLLPLSEPEVLAGFFDRFLISTTAGVASGVEGDLHR